jgi:hypothetical protein
VKNRSVLAFAKYPNWFSPHLHEFWGHRTSCRRRTHWFIALVAPRSFIALEGTRDPNVNANGVRQSILAAQPAFDFLKAGDRLTLNWVDTPHGIAQGIRMPCWLWRTNS